MYIMARMKVRNHQSLSLQALVNCWKGSKQVTSYITGFNKQFLGG